jgi:ribosome-binding factor A
MSRRTERVGNLIRNMLGKILLAKMSDPRFDPVMTSITHVEVPEDLLTARVFISVAGTESEQTRTIASLRHAAGYLQEKLAEQVQLRNTPRLDFQADTKFRKTMDTLNIISQVTEELREKEQAQATTPSDETAES